MNFQQIMFRVGEKNEFILTQDVITIVNKLFCTARPIMAAVSGSRRRHYRFEPVVFDLGLVL